MNGFIKATVTGLCLGTGLASMVGCYEYRQLVDPCWPERYNAEARLSVRDTFAAQAYNGHVLDQTVWNYNFEADPKTGGPTDRLNASGMERLKYLVRRKPVPDSHLYLQTAQDIPGAATMAPDKLAQARSELDNRRVAAVQKYVSGIMSGYNQQVAFQVAIHDPAEVGLAATPIGGNLPRALPVNGAIPAMQQNFKGKMDEKAGVLSTGGTGS
jgi:hypothetical protein